MEIIFLAFIALAGLSSPLQEPETELQTGIALTRSGKFEDRKSVV